MSPTASADPAPSTGATDPQAPGPSLGWPGAVAGQPPDDRVAAHFGEPSREQRLLLSGCGLVDRSHRDVLRVGGQDRLGWLHSLTTQHLSELPDGVSTEALVLSPHGHVEHHVQVTGLDGAVLLDGEPTTGAPLLGYLESMRFLLRVEPEAVDAGVLSLVGPVCKDVLAAVGLPAPAAGAARSGEVDGERVVVRGMDWPGPGGADLLVGRAALDRVSARLLEAGARPAGLDAFEALRVESRVPRLGFESDHRTIPNELPWLSTAVHLQKGCYRGQETVARVHNLGRPPRRFVLVHLDGSVDELPGRGDPLTWQGRAVGFVGTAVRHHELGPVALALVKRNTPDDAELTVGRVAALIEPED